MNNYESPFPGSPHNLEMILPILFKFSFSVEGSYGKKKKKIAQKIGKFRRA